MGYKCGVKHLTLGDTNCARGQVAELYEASCRSSCGGGGGQLGEPSEHQTNPGTASHPAPAITGPWPWSSWWEPGLGRR
jgi:hypothetical protein